MDPCGALQANPLQGFQRAPTCSSLTTGSTSTRSTQAGRSHGQRGGCLVDPFRAVSRLLKHSDEATTLHYYYRCGMPSATRNFSGGCNENGRAFSPAMGTCCVAIGC